jgi:hypothetical protein
VQPSSQLFLLQGLKYVVIEVEMSSELSIVLTVGKLDTHGKQRD